MFEFIDGINSHIKWKCIYAYFYPPLTFSIILYSLQSQQCPKILNECWWVLLWQHRRLCSHLCALFVHQRLLSPVKHPEEKMNSFGISSALIALWVFSVLIAVNHPYLKTTEPLNNSKVIIHLLKTLLYTMTATKLLCMTTLYKI